jgi:kynurenine formamidase
MRRRLVDLSVLVENSPSEPMEIEIDRLGPRWGAWRFCFEVFWNRRLPLRKRAANALRFITGKARLLPWDFPDRAFLTLDTVRLPTHMGTHVDAPVHYGPATSGDRSRSVDELPLEWFYNRGVKLDLRHMRKGQSIEVEDLVEALDASGHQLQAEDIVLIWTATDRLWGKREYFSDAPGMSRAATAWLVERQIKLIGIDTYGFDRPFGAMLSDFFQTRDPRHLWPAHFYGREREYIQIERLANLDQLPATGFDVVCFPLRIRGLDASWVRAVGVVPENKLQS